MDPWTLVDQPAADLVSVASPLAFAWLDGINKRDTHKSARNSVKFLPCPCAWATAAATTRTASSFFNWPRSRLTHMSDKSRGRSRRADTERVRVLWRNKQKRERILPGDWRTKKRDFKRWKCKKKTKRGRRLSALPLRGSLNDAGRSGETRRSRFNSDAESLCVPSGGHMERGRQPRASAPRTAPSVSCWNSSLKVPGGWGGERSPPCFMTLLPPFTPSSSYQDPSWRREHEEANIWLTGKKREFPAYLKVPFYSLYQCFFLPICL